MEIRYDLDIREIRNPIILGQYKLFYLGFWARARSQYETLPDKKSTNVDEIFIPKQIYLWKESRSFT